MKSTTDSVSAQAVATHSWPGESSASARRSRSCASNYIVVAHRPSRRHRTASVRTSGTDAIARMMPVSPAEGRGHRDGQKATPYDLFGEDTVEKGIVSTLVERLRTMKAMVGDDTETRRQIEAFLGREAAPEPLAA